MTILAIVIVLIVLAILLPALGVSLDPVIMRIVVALIAIALIVWLFTGSGLLVR